MAGHWLWDLLKSDSFLGESLTHQTPAHPRLNFNAGRRAWNASRLQQPAIMIRWQVKNSLLASSVSTRDYLVGKYLLGTWYSYVHHKKIELIRGAEPLHPAQAAHSPPAWLWVLPGMGHPQPKAPHFFQISNLHLHHRKALVRVPAL